VNLLSKLVVLPSVHSTHFLGDLWFSASQTQLEYLNLRDDALEGVSASPEKLSLFNALVEAATAGSSLKHVDLSGECV